MSLSITTPIDLNHESVSELHTDIVAKISQGQPCTLDLSQTRTIDTAGVQLILVSHRAGVGLVSIPAAVQEALNVLGLSAEVDCPDE